MLYERGTYPLAVVMVLFVTGQVFSNGKFCFILLPVDADSNKRELRILGYATKSVEYVQRMFHMDLYRCYRLCFVTAFNIYSADVKIPQL